MKNLLLLLAFVGATSCSYSQNKVSASEVQKLNWLIGSWTNLTTEPGTTGYEKWEKLSATEWKGTAATMKDAQVLFEEKLKIITKDGLIYYVADVGNNQGPVHFKFTELTTNSFVCENPDHDFPKKITYKLEGIKINASISGGGKSYDFVFEKK